MSNRITKSVYKFGVKLKNYLKDTLKVIIFESIYFMDDDVYRIKEIVNLVIKYNALTFLDEVHVVDMCGKNRSRV